jgi:hypothetical protein
MAWTQSDIDTIERAIAGGELRVRFPDGSEVQYQTTSEMLKARDAMKTVVAGSGAGGGTRCTYASFRKG